MVTQSALVETPLGTVRLSWGADALTGVDLEPAGPAAGNPGAAPGWLAAALEAYFRDGSRPLDLPVRLEGTPFQQRVWQVLRAIPPGEVRTYGSLARELGTSPRAVGGACRANPCPIVVPCHRVVAAGGLGGFAGERTGRKLAVKRWLLRHEGVADLE